MRRTASTALVALLLALAPAGTAFSQDTAEQAMPPAATATVQAQENQNEDDDNTGLWGLLGLLGLAGLIPWRKKHEDHRESNTRSTGM